MEGDLAPAREYFRGITPECRKSRTEVYGGRRVIEAAEGRATHAAGEGETIMPSYLIKHADHPEVFGLWPSGLVRHIGPAEYRAYTMDAAPPVPLLITEDAAEYERLLMYTRALQD